jgi:hypothetical protein
MPRLRLVIEYEADPKYYSFDEDLGPLSEAELAQRMAEADNASLEHGGVYDLFDAVTIDVPSTRYWVEPAGE